MDRIDNLLKFCNFEKNLEKLAKKYKNKKVILYGDGFFFKKINDNFDLSCLNIIGFSDIRFKNTENNTPSDKEYMGYNVIPPDEIFKYEPDIVLLTVENDFPAEQYFNEVLFKAHRKKFKYKCILERSLSDKMTEEWLGMMYR